METFIFCGLINSKYNVIINHVDEYKYVDGVDKYNGNNARNDHK